MVDTLQSLLRETRRLAAQQVIMPVEEVRLATRFSRLQNAQEAVPTLIDQMGDSNMHVRRVAINACRRIGRWDDTRLIAALIGCLSDEEGWGRHDAAWALGVSGACDSRVISALKALAGDTRPPTKAEEDDLDIDDDALMARIEAAKALSLLGGGGGSLAAVPPTCSKSCEA